MAIEPRPMPTVPTVEAHLDKLQKQIDDLVAEREKIKGDPSGFQQKKS